MLLLNANGVLGAYCCLKIDQETFFQRLLLLEKKRLFQSRIKGLYRKLIENYLKI